MTQLILLLLLQLSDADQSWDFAVWLEANEHLDYAHTEYQRFAVSYPEDKRTSAAWMKAAYIEYQLKEYDLARNSLLLILTDTLYGQRAQYLLWKLHYWYAIEVPCTTNTLSQDAHHYLQATASLLENDLDLAMQLLSRIRDTSSVWFQCIAVNQTAIDAAINYRIRNPWLYGAYSTVLPGLGQILMDRKADAYMAFALTTSLGLLSVVYANKDDSAQAWGFGITAGLFYLGNIYGVATTARLHNAEAQSNACLEILKILENWLENN